MATLKPSISLISNSSTKQKQTVKTTGIDIPRRTANIPIPGLRTGGFADQMDNKPLKINTVVEKGPDPTVIAKLYAIMEAVADRVEMHRNVGEQRDNWNTLLLTSINSITLAAAVMAGIAAASVGGATAPLKISATVMYVAATGMLSLMNKIQPSQLAEEQRNGARLFKQLHNQIQTVVSIGNPTAADVREMMERVLALDKAYPLPLLGGAMLEKFPAAAEPAVWWPERRRRQSGSNSGFNGWNGKLEEEMREIGEIVRVKDKKEYLRLGEKALRLNKYLAVSGPVLTGLAALGCAMMGAGGGGGCGWAGVVGVLGGALASVVNAVEHGGQVGMVVEMYRSNAGFFEMMEETIESNMEEGDLERRENGEVFEVKVALQLGRSLSQLRDFAAAATGHVEVKEEFASKLF